MTIIRPEADADRDAIARVHRAAFLHDPHRPAGTPPTEHLIVAALREAGALTVSLVADAGGLVLGHVACSPVEIDGQLKGWYGLGPIGVDPGHQRRGTGSALMQEAVERLRALGAAGLVLVGEPAFYSRFGFRQDPRLTFAGAPAVYFQVLPLAGEVPAGEVTFHAAFTAS